MHLKGWEWVGDRLLYVAIAFGLAAGFLGAYGRERNDGRRPGRDWFVNRLLIMPFLGIAATAAATTLLAAMPRAVSTFVAALLAMMAYDVVRVIERRAIRNVERSIDVLTHGQDDDAEVVTQVGSGQGAPEEIEVNIVPPREGNAHGVGLALRRAFKPAPASPDLAALLKRLDPDREDGG
jgi:hypothetical protein